MRRKKAAIRTAGEAEYKALPRQKLLEEVNEYMENGSSGELADILEVITALAGTCGLSFDDLVKMATEKRKERGGFEGEDRTHQCRRIIMNKTIS